MGGSSWLLVGANWAPLWGSRHPSGQFPRVKTTTNGGMHVDQVPSKLHFEQCIGLSLVWGCLQPKNVDFFGGGGLGGHFSDISCKVELEGTIGLIDTRKSSWLWEVYKPFPFVWPFQTNCRAV